MAANKAPLFSLSLTFLILSHTCLAQLELPQQHFWQTMQQGQQHRLRAKTSCRIDQLSAREPSYTYESEAGRVEFWDSNAREFECAGIQVVRHVIEPNGLLLPYYTNAPQLVYIIKGSGVHGTVIPGCAETYESGSSSESRGEERGEERTRNDRHQKLHRFRQGDILALPQGFTHWAYNDGDTPIITVSLIDVANEANQLDLNFRKFFLAGSQRSSGQSRRGEHGQRGQEHGRREEEGEQEEEKRNIFSGFDEELLADAFNLEPETIRRLQSREDNRGFIVRAEKLRFVLPEYEREEQEREHQSSRGHGGGYNPNGLEETFCTLKIRQNIDHPTRADIFNPRGGRLTTLNSQSLPILSYLRLSAHRGRLYRNAMMAPHWNPNTHSIMYVTRGRARVQVAGSEGRLVFDEEVRKGQVLVVPQNYVIVKRAGEEGFEWVGFKTNDNAMSSQLAGRLSVLRGMPEEVLMNAYGVSRRDAKNLKYSREEGTLFSPADAGSRSTGGGYA